MITEYLKSFITNNLIQVALISVIISQSLKIILTLILEHKFDTSRIFGDGGMPSSHSTVVTSVAMVCGFANGFNSYLFGIAFIVAYIVMHDAKGVRLETGKQAEVINDMIKLLTKMGQPDLSPEKKLKEFVGHTAIQVIAGCVLGLIIGIVFCYIKGLI